MMEYSSLNMFLLIFPHFTGPLPGPVDFHFGLGISQNWLKSRIFVKMGSSMLNMQI